MARQKKATEAVAATEPEQPQRRRGPRAGSENARRGGMAVKEKYGSEFFVRIGSMGGRAARERHGSNFYSDIGRIGGQRTRDTLGAEHYERIGKLGGLRAGQRGHKTHDADTAK